MSTGNLIGNPTGNLIQNPSFESDLAHWRAQNVTISKSSPCEGTRAAGLGPGVSALSQDAPLDRAMRGPLFFSFMTYGDPGAADLTAEVLWLGGARNVIGTGLQTLVPGGAIGQARKTVFDVTGPAPPEAAFARLVFSTGKSRTPVFVDLINLFPIQAPNLLCGPGLDRDAGGPDFASAAREIPLGAKSAGAAYLWGVPAAPDTASDNAAHLEFVDALGDPIETPGSDAFVPAGPLPDSVENAAPFLMVSPPQPKGAARLRLSLGASPPPCGRAALVRLASPNLLRDPDFAQGLQFYTGVNVAAAVVGGRRLARMSGRGAMLSQTVRLPRASSKGCFFLSFGLHFPGGDKPNGDLFAQVHWLNRRGSDLGEGLKLIVSQRTQPLAQRQLYLGVTGPAPRGVHAAMVQFTKSQGGEATWFGLDGLVFAKVA